MAAPLAFWFDFSSPYAYLASQSIEALAARHGRSVHWQPLLLGAVFKTTGAQPPIQRHPAIAAYYRRDFARSARFANVSFALPAQFPIATQNTARLLLALADQAPQAVSAYARGAMAAYFTSGAPINDPDWLTAFAATLGLPAAETQAALVEPQYKERLRQQCEQAIDAGIFGSPWIIADGEPFWGHDRLPQLERWLATGGF